MGLDIGIWVLIALGITVAVCILAIVLAVLLKQHLIKKSGGQHIIADDNITSSIHDCDNDDKKGAIDNKSTVSSEEEECEILYFGSGRF